MLGSAAGELISLRSFSACARNDATARSVEDGRRKMHGAIIAMEDCS